MQPRRDPSLGWASSDSSIAKTIPRFRTETPWRDAAASLELAGAPRRSARSIIGELGFELEHEDAPEHDGTLRGKWRARLPWLVVGGALFAWVAFHHAHREEDEARAVTTTVSVPTPTAPLENIAKVEHVEHVETAALAASPTLGAQKQDERVQPQAVTAAPERAPLSAAKGLKSRRPRPRNRVR